MGRTAQWPPRVHHHRATGQARVRIRGKDYYLGLYGSPATAKRYAELVAAEADGQRPTPRRGPLSVAEALERYLAHAEAHYRGPTGEETGEMGWVRRAAGVLLATHGSQSADTFRGKALKEARAFMVEKGWCRNSVNHHVRVVKRMWRWLAGEELVLADTLASVRAVEPLKAGRTAAPERAPVGPADAAAVEAALRHLTPHLAAAVRLQLATACRPGEALGLRPCEIDTTPDVWLWRPARHKTAHAGRERLVLVGPKARAVIASLIAQRTDAPPGGDYYLFSPRQSELQRRRQRRACAPACRRTPLAGRCDVGERFTGEAYAKAVSRACAAAGVPPWTPNQLRHLALTRLAEEFGPLVAQTVAGHSSLRTTEIYAARSLTAALEAVRQVG